MWRTLVICSLFACGSGGGPADSSALVYNLDTADSIAECDYLVETYPVKTYTCAGQSYPIGFGRDCAAGIVVQPSCMATVAAFEQCLKSGYAVTQDELCADLANGTTPVLDDDCTAVDSSDCH